MMLWVLLVLPWVLLIPLTLETAASMLYHYLRKRRRIRHASNGNTYLIQITTKDAPYELLKETISEIRKHTDVPILVVTDNQKPKRVKLPNVHYLIVPPDYKDGHGKARALNYALDWKLKHYDPTTTYTLFIDEENVPTPELLHYFTTYNGKISIGPARYVDGNKLTWLLDGIRVVGDYNFEMFAARGYPAWHGENVICRLDIEAAVRWPSGLAEDLLFHSRVYKKFGRIYEWHDYPVISHSPLTLKDFFKQRRRWVLGVIQAIKRKVPIADYLAYRLVSWALGLWSVLAVFASVIIHPPFIPPLLALAVVWPAAYLEGWRQNKVPWKYRILGLLGVYFLALLETATFYYALFKPTDKFDIIQKKPVNGRVKA